MIESIRTAQPYLRPFPEFEDVFTEPLALQRRHFLPLISLDASVVDKELSGWLHFVTPIEPLLELDVGYFTREFHDYYNSMGQYAFQVVDGKYRFTGDFRYFAYESGEIYRAMPGLEHEIEADYQLRFSTYEESKRGYRLHGRIPWYAETPYVAGSDICGPLISQVGGKPVSSRSPEPEGPVNRRGTPFRYIGEVQGYSYCGGGIQAILLFYDPEEQIALFRTEWT
ncbi:hypothetical protein [Anatilimnocola floriformis]|uniref:hypothetical protein n=1 Tax=Anatilimnocola floriformis TaxID=2948575 RepID=UPI0020C3A526|nr:hypothetical protein [Anatilimnocola floriformis]